MSRCYRNVLPLPLIGLFLLLATTTLPAQSPNAGTEFYTALPNLGIASNASFRISISSEQTATVTITQTESGTSVSRLVEPNSPWEYEIGRSLIDIPFNSEGRSSRSLHISSSAPISVHAFHEAFFYADGWVVPPVRDLGTDYRVMSVDGANSTLGGIILVVATHDSTLIRITPTATTSSANLPGFTYGINLRKGECWQITPSVPEFTDLSGTRIESNYPVAVLSGHRGTANAGPGAANPLVESVPEVRDWNTRYYGAPLSRHLAARYKVVAAQNNTVVKINGSTVGTLAAGGTTGFMVNGPAVIEGSGPIEVAQFTDFEVGGRAKQTADPSMTLLQPSANWGYRFLWTTPALPDRPNELDTAASMLVPFEHYVQVHVRDYHGEPVLLDGSDISGFLVNRQNGNDVYFANIPIQPGTHVLRSSQPATVQAYGYSYYDAYFAPVALLKGPLAEIASTIDTLCGSQVQTGFVITNRTGDSLVVSSLTFDPGSSPFVLTNINPGLPFTIAGASQKQVQFTVSGLPRGLTTISGTVMVRRKGELVEFPVRFEKRIVRPAPSISALVDTLRFSDTTAPGESARAIAQIRNDRDEAVTIWQIVSSGPFLTPNSSGQFTIGGSDSAAVNVTFRPTAQGTFIRSLYVIYGPCRDTLLLPVAAISQRLSHLSGVPIDSARLLCPSEGADSLTVRLYNDDQVSMKIDSLRLFGTDAGDFYTTLGTVGQTVGSKDSIDIRVGYSTQKRGPAVAGIRIFANGGRDSADVALVGVREHQELVATLAFPFGDIEACTDSIERDILLQNAGTIAVNIVSVQSRTTVFESTSSTVPSIDIDSVASVAIRFSATLPGLYRDTIDIRIAPCDTVLSIPVEATVQASDIRVVVIPSTPLHQLPCRLPDTVAVEVRNDGDVTDSIATVALTSINGSWHYIDRSENRIKPGEKLQLRFVLDSIKSGDGAARIDLTTNNCGLVKTSFLDRSISYSDVSFDVDTISFNSLVPDVESIRSNWIRNNGESEIEIESITLTGLPDGVQARATGLPRILRSGDSLEIPVAALGTDSLTFTGRLILSIRGGCDTVASFVVNATEEPLTFSLSTSDITGDIDQVISIPIVLSQNFQTSRSYRLPLNLMWDYQLLYPIAARTTDMNDSIEILGNEISGNERYLTLAFTGDSHTGDTLFYVDARVLLTDHLRTPIQLDATSPQFSVPFPNVTVSTTSGSFTASGYCELDGQRLIQLRQTLVDAKLFNDAQSKLQRLDIFAGLQTRVHGTLYDVAGRTLEELGPFDCGAGISSHILDFSRFDAGTYFLKLWDDQGYSIELTVLVP